MKKIIKKFLEVSGYDIHRYDPHRNQEEVHRLNFQKQSRTIHKKHQEHTKEQVIYLNKKYDEPVLGKVRVWEVIKLLAQCIDPTDNLLYCVNQQIHIMQALESMEKEGISDPDLLIAMLVHDLGKILLLTGEAPENVVCGNVPIGEYEKGIGLDNCVFQWNHAEFIYLRLKDYVPEHVAWLIRYHSMSITQSEPFMNERDKLYTNKYFYSFHKHDVESKSLYYLPNNKLDNYRDLIEETFSQPIFF